MSETPAGEHSAFEAIVEGLFHAMYEPDDFRAGLREAMAAAWRKGHDAGRDYQGDGWNSDAHDPDEDNPYRVTNFEHYAAALREVGFSGKDLLRNRDKSPIASAETAEGSSDE